MSIGIIEEDECYPTNTIIIWRSEGQEEVIILDVRINRSTGTEINNDDTNNTAVSRMAHDRREQQSKFISVVLYCCCCYSIHLLTA